MFEPERLCTAQAEPVAAPEHSDLGEIEGIGPGLELAGIDAGPAAASGHARGEALAEVVAGLGIEKHRGRAAAAEHLAHAAAEQRLLLFEPGHPDRKPVAAEAAVDCQARQAIGRTCRACLELLPHVAG